MFARLDLDIGYDSRTRMEHGVMYSRGWFMIFSLGALGVLGTFVAIS